MSALVPHGIKGMDRLQRQLRDYPRFIVTQTRNLLHKHARSLISSSGENMGMVQFIPPGSLDRKVTGTAAKKQGEAKVEAQIWKVYGTWKQVYKIIKAKNAAAAKGYWAACMRKDWVAANGLARRLGVPVLQDFTQDDGAEHKRRRVNGQVKGKDKTLYVTDARYVRAYIRMKQQLVGLLAASLVNHYDGRFGALKGVPAWVSRHSGSWASAQIEEFNQGDGPRVRMAVNGGSLNSELQRWFNTALRYRLKLMKKEAPYFIRGAAKAAGMLK
ncbi:MAG TPA: hypothetical protein DDZ88_16440 [Verrucomicrobiales bacterium]|nr:hypothetical protein [Verrucomicrobiales bacterium]